MAKHWLLTLLIFSVNVIADVKATSLTDIESMAPQDVAYQGEDGCKYYGNTSKVNSRGRVIISRRECAGKTTPISAQAYLTYVHPAERVVPMVPAGSGWIIKPGQN